MSNHLLKTYYLPLHCCIAWQLLNVKFLKKVRLVTGSWPTLPRIRTNGVQLSVLEGTHTQEANKIICSCVFHLSSLVCLFCHQCTLYTM